MTRLVIKWSNTGCNERCELCGFWDRVPVGPALFVEGTGTPACRECAIEHEPTLVGVLDFFADAGGYVPPEGHNYHPPRAQEDFEDFEEVPAEVPEMPF